MFTVDPQGSVTGETSVQEVPVETDETGNEMLEREGMKNVCDILSTAGFNLCIKVPGSHSYVARH